MASDFRREVVIISFAAAVAELLTGLRFCVEVPFGEVALAGTWLFRLLARIKIIRSDAEFFALFPGLEFIGVSEAAAVDELSTLLSTSVVVPSREVSLAWPGDLWQVAGIFAFRLHAHFFALFLGLESIVVTLAATVPEPRASTVLRVEVPFDGEVSAGSSVPLQGARRPRSRWNRQTALEVLSLSFLGPVRATSVLRGVASASGEVRTLRRRSSIRAALEFCVLATAALSMRSFSDGDAIGAATKLIRVTGTTLVIWSTGRCEAIWTATVRRVLAATTLVVWSTSGGAVVWTAAESRVLASAAVEVWTASWQYVIWTALERCRQTTTLSVRTVCWSATVVAAAISAILAGHVAAVVVRAKSW